MGDQGIRVSLRELYEIPYRALVGAGASPGEAAVAAEAVRTAEIISGAGLASLLTQSARGPWRTSGLGIIETEPTEPAHAEPVHVEAEQGERWRVHRVVRDATHSELGLAQLLVDVTEGLGPRSVVSCSWTEGALESFESALGTAARRSEFACLAARRTPEGLEFNLADPAGGLSTGAVDASEVRDFFSVLPDGDLCVAMLAPADAESLEKHVDRAWSHENIEQTRERVAVEGLNVLRREWDRVRALAARYAQPDMETATNTQKKSASA